ncbi:MAG: hypothetical protein R3279_05760 [Putridiphycobacter sp.]|nr:hypothetical protein [Putridiphycobacter sp.]
MIKHTVFIILMIASVACQKEDIANRHKLIIGKWDCIDYADSVTHIFKGRPPVFISNLYENGYAFKNDNIMWTRNLGGDNKMYTDKRVECQWTLNNGHTQLNLMFPDNIETYTIVEMTRKKMTIKGFSGLWGQSANTLVFEKQ